MSVMVQKEKQLGGSSVNRMESESGGTKTKKKKSKERASGLLSI